MAITPGQPCLPCRIFPLSAQDFLFTLSRTPSSVKPSCRSSLYSGAVSTSIQDGFNQGFVDKKLDPQSHDQDLGTVLNVPREKVAITLAPHREEEAVAASGSVSSSQHIKRTLIGKSNEIRAEKRMKSLTQLNTEAEQFNEGGFCDETPRLRDDPPSEGLVRGWKMLQKGEEQSAVSDPVVPCGPVVSKSEASVPATEAVSHDSQAGLFDVYSTFQTQYAISSTQTKSLERPVNSGEYEAGNLFISQDLSQE